MRLGGKLPSNLEVELGEVEEELGVLRLPALPGERPVVEDPPAPGAAWLNHSLEYCQQFVVSER